MSPTSFALLERLHGHLALLGLALLVHPLLTLLRHRDLRPRTLLSAELAAALLLATSGLGGLLYPTYRTAVKPDLVRQDLGLALRFESKEHLALMTAALVLGGALALRQAGPSEDARHAAWWMLALALLCGILTAGLGLHVAAGAHPGW